MNPDLIHEHVRAQPARPALWFAGRWYSYGELDTRAHQLAARLQAQGIGRGDRVGIVALNHIAHIDLLLAAPHLGFIFTPFNYRLSVEEHRGLAAYIRPTLMLADAACRAHGEASGCPLLPLDGYEAWRTSAPPLSTVPAPGADDIHMILFTGGSTGLPKGAQLPYRQVLANCRNTADGWSLDADDCVIQATPCFHAALNVFTTPLLQLGGRVVLLPQFEAADYLRQCVAQRVTRLFMVPTMYQMLAAEPGFAGADLSSVRWAISGGAACPPTVRDLYARRGIHFKQGYGMTEAGVNCFTIDVDEAACHPDSVGRPLPNTQAVVRRPDGSACDVDEVGELTLAGPHVCAGFFEKNAEWAKVFRDGWLWTGDLCRRDAQGLHYIVGRSKEMFISGGENIYPVEVESALYQCDGIAEAAVVGIADDKWGEVGLAAVALKPGSARQAEDLRRELKTRLAGYKVPREYLFLPALPKTGAGKINKPQIRQLFVQTRESKA
jgi:fatty-acyl-CoA synthase